MCAILLVSHGGRAMEPSGYSVLHFNGKAITTNGRIDFSRWGKMDFPWSFAVNTFAGTERQCFYPVGDLFFEVSSQDRINELSKRFEREANARKDLAIKNGHLYYKGKKLKYSGHIHGGDRPWGITAQDDPPQGFRFANYLIFMVQARLNLREDPFDLVVYDLKDDSFAVHQTHGSWPQVWLFQSSEAVPDPRNNAGKPVPSEVK